MLPSSVTRAGQKGRDASQGGKIGKCFQTGVVSCAGATENSNKDWKASIRLAGRWLTALALAVVMTNGNIKSTEMDRKVESYRNTNTDTSFVTGDTEQQRRDVFYRSA